MDKQRIKNHNITMHMVEKKQEISMKPESVITENITWNKHIYNIRTLSDNRNK